ncbi:cofilin, partial [Perkinsus chesapeaki]
DECIARFNNLKENHDKRYIIYKLNDNRVVVDSEGDRGQKYDDFYRAILASGEPRFGVIDFEFDNENTGDRMVLVLWIPETAASMMKMKYASVKNEMSIALSGIYRQVQATDEQELDIEAIKQHFLTSRYVNVVMQACKECDLWRMKPEYIFKKVVDTLTVQYHIDTGVTRPHHMAALTWDSEGSIELLRLSHDGRHMSIEHRRRGALVGL